MMLGPPLLSTRPTCYVPKHTHIYGVCWMRHISSTHHPLVKVRPSSYSPYRGVISCRLPEYQYPWFRFIGLSNFTIRKYKRDERSVGVIRQGEEGTIEGLGTAREDGGDDDGRRRGRRRRRRHRQQRRHMIHHHGGRR